VIKKYKEKQSMETVVYINFRVSPRIKCELQPFCKGWKVPSYWYGSAKLAPLFLQWLFTEHWER